MKKPKVLVTCLLPGDTQDSLKEDFDLTVFPGPYLAQEELQTMASDKDAIICNLTNKIDDRFFAACPDIKLVANVAVGYDNICLESARKHGVIVSNTPGVLTETTADLAFSLILGTARRITQAEKYLRDGKWTRFSLNLLLGVDVHHKTLGIVGFGRIGQAVAARARGFSMKILYSQRKQVSQEIENSLQAEFVSLEELLKRSDFVSLHCPLTKESRDLIGKEQLQLMKKTAILINTARGAIVNESALSEALKTETIGGAGLDVYEHEPEVTEGLLEQENVVLLPHIGSASIETRTAMGQLAVDAVNNAFKGQMPTNLVNAELWDEFLKRSSSIGTSS